jgi:hypothetical protein
MSGRPRNTGTRWCVCRAVRRAGSQRKLTLATSSPSPLISSLRRRSPATLEGRSLATGRIILSTQGTERQLTRAGIRAPIAFQSSVSLSALQLLLLQWLSARGTSCVGGAGVGRAPRRPPCPSLTTCLRWPRRSKGRRLGASKSLMRCLEYAPRRAPDAFALKIRPRPSPPSKTRRHAPA